MVFRLDSTDPNHPPARHAGLRIPTSGVRAELDDNDWWTDLQAMALVLPEQAVFSHTTAAHIAGIPLPSPGPKPFHVTVPHHRGRRKGIVWHKRSALEQPQSLKGYPVTGPLRTWLDLGSLLEVPDLVAALDHLLRRGLVPADTIAEIPRLPGAGMLRAAASLASPRSWSPRESVLRVQMHCYGLPDPELNKDIIEDGILLGTGDLVFEEFRCILDYDGDTHKEAKQRTQDTKTRNAYSLAGWRHLAITSHMYDNLSRTLFTIENLLRQCGWDEPLTPRTLPSPRPSRFAL